MKRVLLYSALAVLLTALAVGAQRYAASERTSSEVALAAAYLAAGDTAGARSLLEPLGSHEPVVARGLAWCDVLEGRSADRVDGASGSPLVIAGDVYPDALLLRQLLVRGRSEAAASLIASAEAAPRADLAVIDRIARLEAGENFSGTATERARSQSTANSAGTGESALERQLASVLELRRKGGQTFIRDRAGRLLGALDEQGGLHATEAGHELRLDGWIEDELTGPELGLARPAGRQGSQPNGVRLSLDLELSRLAAAALADQRGTIVVVEAASGRVLAAVSDPVTIGREGTSAFRDQRLEPASIAKLITASAALRAGLDLDHDIRRSPCHGFVPVGDGRLYCPVVPGRLNGLEHAMAVSCNTTFARLGDRLGHELIEAEYQRFGFARYQPATTSVSTQATVATTLPGARQTARLRSPIDSQRRLAEVSIGLNHSELSPLHAAMMAAVFGNGGRLTEPSWVAARDGALGLAPDGLGVVPQEAPILGARELARLQGAMAAVPLYGTAGGIAPLGFPIAMKTGTASEPSRGFHVNHIGVAPWPNPRYAFAVRITDQRTSRRVRRAAYAATARFLEALARYDRSQQDQNGRRQMQIEQPPAATSVPAPPTTTSVAAVF